MIKKFKNIKKRYIELIHLIRFSQSHLMDVYHPEDLMKCPIHFCLGQETLASALSFNIKKNDYLLSHHRSHAYYLAKKCSLEKMIAEFYGKKNGSNYGLAGSQELSLSSQNFFSGTILSGMFAISLGTAYSQKMKKKNEITITVIGDGGMEEGIVYETMNLASLHNLPILFICENNRFSVHTSMKKRTLINNFKNKVKSFGIKYVKINSSNIEKIYEKATKCINEVRNNKKPIFLEFDTFRECGHVGPENDDREFNYRKNDIKKWSKLNPFKKYLAKMKKNEIKKLEKIFNKNELKVKKMVLKAKNNKTIDFKESLKLNFIKSYSKVIKRFNLPVKNFAGGQKETKLKPY